MVAPGSIFTQTPTFNLNIITTRRMMDAFIWEARYPVQYWNLGCAATVIWASIMVDIWFLSSLCSMQCIHAIIGLSKQILDIKRCLHVCPQSGSSIRNLVTLVGKLPSSQWCDSLVQGFDSRLIRRIRIRLFCSLATQVIQMLNVLPPPSTSSPTSTSCPFARTAPTSLLISRSQIAKDNFEIESASVTKSA